MSSLTFDDFEEYAGKIGHAQLQFTLPRVERPFWSIQHREIAGVQLQCGSEANGLIVEGAASSDGYLLFVQKSGSRCHANGERMPEDALFVSPPRGEFRLASNDAHDWYSLLIPTSLLPAEACDTAREITTARLLRPSGGHVEELTRLVGRLQKTTLGTPNGPSEPNANGNAREEILTLATEILGVREPSPASADKGMGRPVVVRDQVISAVRRQIEASADNPPSVAQLAELADVSERTLRTVFQEFYGISPRRFLHLRRLHKARKALLQRNGGLTIAQIASSLGFWDLGRFAGDYRRVFGESPSTSRSSQG